MNFKGGEREKQNTRCLIGLTLVLLLHQRAVSKETEIREVSSHPVSCISWEVCGYLWHQ